MWNLRRGRDEAVQDDGDCGLKPETFQIVSQFAKKNKAGGPETARPSSVLAAARPDRCEEDQACSRKALAEAAANALQELLSETSSANRGQPTRMCC